MTESQIQQQVIQNLSALAVKHNFVYFSPMNETFMTMVKQFGIPDSKSFPMFEYMKKMGFTPGDSDIVIVKKEKVYFLELKKPGKKKKESQILFSKNVLKAGAEYGTAHDWDEVLWCLKLWGVVK